MIHIHFIINPISGKGKHVIDTVMLSRYFPEDRYKIATYYTKQRKHAIELTNSIVGLNPDCIVACGGDGTINEVASCLVNTKIKLGIIPVGSGNGLASNLNIPRNIEQAIAIIKNEFAVKIDVGAVNGKYFFSNMGVGIDAMIIKKYEASNRRTLVSYIEASIRSSMKFKAPNAVLTFNNSITHHRPFLLFISNSNEMGYGMSLTPEASLTDGWLDLLVVPELTFTEKLNFGMMVLRKKIDKFQKARHELIQRLHIELPEKIFTDVQIDGESHNLKTNIIDISVIRRGIEVYVPEITAS